MTCGYAVYSNRLSMRFATAGLGAFNLFSGLAIAISDLLPDSAIVLADAAAHLAWLGYFLQLKRGQHYRKFGIFGPIGLDRERCAVGTKIAFPERLMIVGCGDGCFTYIYERHGVSRALRCDVRAPQSVNSGDTETQRDHRWLWHVS